MTALDADRHHPAVRRGSDVLRHRRQSAPSSYGPVVGWAARHGGAACSASSPGCAWWARPSSSTACCAGCSPRSGRWPGRPPSSPRWSARHGRCARRARSITPGTPGPGRLFLLLLAVGFTVGWSIARLGQWLPKRAHGLRHPLVAWSLALPVWVALAAGMLSLAPGAAYLWLLPLLGAGLLFSFRPRVERRRRARGVCASFCWSPRRSGFRNTVDLLRFIVAIFGRLPIVTPIFVYAAVMAAAGLMLVPPLVAALATDTASPLRRSSRRRRCLFAVAATGKFAYMAPAYTNEEPLRRVARAVQEGDGPARLGGGIGRAGRRSRRRRAVGLDAGSRSRRRPQCRCAGLPHPFVFRATGTEPRPCADHHRRARLSNRSQAGIELAVTVMPRMPGSGRVVRAARRARAGAGRTCRASSAARPMDGDLSGADAGRARLPRELRPESTPAGCAIFASSPPRSGPGDGSGWQPPPWLPQARTAWTADAVVDRGALRAADCAGSAATLDYVAVTAFGVISADDGSMTNPFVYGEIVPVAAFVDREVELDRLGRDLYAGQKVFLISPRRYGKSSLVRQALEERRPERRAHRRSAGQQLQLLRRVPRRLRPRAGLGRDARWIAPDRG